MQDPYNLSFQPKFQEFPHQRLKIMLLLSSRHQADQDLPCRIASPQKEMTQVSHMLHLLIIADISLFKILQHTDKDPVHILMHQPAVRRSQNVISAPLLVESQ